MNESAEEYRRRFASGFGSTDQRSRIIEANTRFEAERVRHVLSRFNLSKAASTLTRIAYTEIGQSVLSFDVFNRHFNTFPLVLGSSRLSGIAVSDGVLTPENYAIHTDPFATEPARFKKFGRVPFVIAYTQLYDSVAALAATRPVGLVFPRKGFLHGMCIHNDASESLWPSGLCWVFKATAGGRDRRLFVQPFSAVLDAIVASGWRPDSRGG